MQRPHKHIEARSDGKPKHGKTVEFEDNNKEVNTTENHGDTITEKELLGIVETLKGFRTILLGQILKIDTEHKKLTCKTLITNRVLW